MSCANMAEAGRPVASAHKTLVVALGNPILGDDGVAWQVAEQLAAPLAQHGVELVCLALGGLRLMEQLVGYQQAIVIDALPAGPHPPGHLSVLPLTDLPDHAAGRLTAAHDTSLLTALQLGQRLGASLPQTIMVVGIAADLKLEFSETLTPPVAAAVPQAAAAVLHLLGLERKFSPRRRKGREEGIRAHREGAKDAKKG